MTDEDDTDEEDDDDGDEDYELMPEGDQLEDDGDETDSELENKVVTKPKTKRKPLSKFEDDGDETDSELENEVVTKPKTKRKRLSKFPTTIPFGTETIDRDGFPTVDYAAYYMENRNVRSVKLSKEGNMMFAQEFIARLKNSSKKRTDTQLAKDLQKCDSGIERGTVTFLFKQLKKWKTENFRFHY